MRSWFRGARAVVVAGVLSVSCGGIIDPSQNKVETFSGTIPVAGSAVPPHVFSASKTGEISVKVTALSPSSSAIVGVVWAQAANDNSCTGNILQSSLGQLNLPVISGQIIGKYCIVMYDAGYLSVATNYTVSVSHPP